MSTDLVPVVALNVGGLAVLGDEPEPEPHPDLVVRPSPRDVTEAACRYGWLSGPGWRWLEPAEVSVGRRG